MTPRNLKDAVVVTPGGPITDEMILGHITLFVVPDQPVPAGKLKRLWKEAELPDELLPKDRRAKDAFMVACRSVETRRHINGGTKQAEVKVDEVLEDAETVVYQITHLVRDKDERVIDHEKSMRLVFNKSDETIKTDRLDPAAYKALKGLDDEIRKHYEQNSKRIPGNKLRVVFRKILDSLGAVNLRRGSGGVYFVPKPGDETLVKVKHVLDGLYGMDGDMHLLPCANADAEREMVERHLAFNVNDDLAELMTVVRSYLKDGKAMRSDKLNNTLNRYRSLMEHVERYKVLLGTSMGEVEESLGVLQKQLAKLSEQSDL